MWIIGAVVLCAAVVLVLYLARPSPAVSTAPVAPRADVVVVDAGLRSAQLPALSGTSVVRGVVRDSRGAAVVAEVWIEGTSLRPGRSVRTNADGAFEIVGLREGIYSVSAESAGQAIAPRFGLRLGASETRFLTLFSETGFRFLLRVLEQGSDRPIANARVRFSSSPWFVEGLGERRTGGTGEVAIWASSAQVFAHVEAESFVDEAAATLEKNGVRVVHLSRGVRVAGEVRDERGELVTDGIVEASSIAQARSDNPAEGDAGLPSSTAGEHESLGTTARVPPLPLDGLGSGTSAALEENSLRARVTRTMFAAIDADGTFVFPAVPQGVFHFQARGPAFLDGEPVQKNIAERTAPLSLRVVRGARIDARVRRSGDGATAPEFCTQCPLVLRSVTGDTPVTTSDSGEWHLSHLRAGTFSALYQGRVLGTIELDAGESRSWELQVGDESAHQLQVVDINGSPVRAAHVLLEWQQNGETAQGDTDGQGQVLFAARGGPVRVRVTHSNFANFVGSWPQLQQRVVLQNDGCSVSTRLTSRASGERIAQAEVIWVRDSAELDFLEARRISPSEPDTEFVAAHLPAVPHYVVVRADGYAMVAQPVADVCVQPRLEIGLEPLFQFEGDVVDARGSTQAGARVWLEGHEASEAISDANGHYSLRAPAGESVVRARSSIGEGFATLTMSHRDRLQPFILHVQRRPDGVTDCPWTRAFDGNLHVRLSPMTARAGLLPTDTLQVMGNMPMHSYDDFAAACANVGTLRVQIERDGQLIDAWIHR